MQKTIGLLCLLLAQPLFAQSPQYRDKEEAYKGVHLIRGTVVSAYRVDPSEDIDTGFGIDANYSSVALNGGVAIKKFGDHPFRSGNQNEPEDEAADEQVNNAYLGVGFGRIIQLQYGYGNHGGLTRLRSDFNFRSVVNFLTQTTTPKDRLTLADRITFTTAFEGYHDSDEEIFDNFTWGVGLLF